MFASCVQYIYMCVCVCVCVCVFPIKRARCKVEGEVMGSKPTECTCNFQVNFFLLV